MIVRARRPVPPLPALTALFALLALACGGREEPTVPEPPPVPPDLTGAFVLLLPTQGEPGLDAELAFWLGERAPMTTWVPPERLREVVARSPGWRLRLDALPPGFTELRGTRRVSGQLYDHLRRLGAILDARLALVPYASPVVDSAGVALQMTGVLVDVVGGRVVWHGTVRGDPAAPGERPSPASAAEALARALSPF